MLGDAFENVFATVQGASENLYVDKLLNVFKDVLENTYVTNEFAIFENVSVIILNLLFFENISVTKIVLTMSLGIFIL